MRGRRRRSQWVFVSLAMRGAGEKMRAGSREKSVSRGGERFCCIRSGIGEFCQDGVFSSQDQGVTTEPDRSRFIGRTRGSTLSIQRRRPRSLPYSPGEGVG